MKQLPLPFPPDTIDFIITQDGKFAGTYTVKIDWIDRDLLQYNWRINMSNNRYGAGKPYAYGRIGRKSQSLHRFILERKLEIEFESGMLLWSDHADMDTLNNTRDNLRAATPSQNIFNQGLRSHNTSGYTGVRKEGSRWLAYIGTGGKTIRLGTYETKDEAVTVRREAEIKYYGEFAKVA